MFDPHNGGGAHLVTTLDHVAPSQLHVGVDWYFS